MAEKQNSRLRWGLGVGATALAIVLVLAATTLAVLYTVPVAHGMDVTNRWAVPYSDGFKELPFDVPVLATCFFNWSEYGSTQTVEVTLTNPSNVDLITTNGVQGYLGFVGNPGQYTIYVSMSTAPPGGINVSVELSYVTNGPIL